MTPMVTRMLKQLSGLNLHFSNTLDYPPQIRYNIWVVKRTQMNETYVQGVVIDVCTRTFLILGNDGQEKVIECNSSKEFMNVLEVCTSNLNNDEIQYADLAVKE